MNRQHPPNWTNWEVRAVRWVMALEASKNAVPDEPTAEDATILHVLVDVVEVVRTDQLPQPWNLG